MPTWFFLLLFGLGGLVLPMIGFQFRLLNLLGPFAPVVSIGLLVGAAIAFVASRNRASTEAEAEAVESDVEASRKLREMADRERS